MNYFKFTGITYSPCIFTYSCEQLQQSGEGCGTGLRVNKNNRTADSYHKRTDASLRRFPFKTAVDVAACVDEEHDAAANSIEVSQQQLRDKQHENNSYKNSTQVVNAAGVQKSIMCKLC